MSIESDINISEKIWKLDNSTHYLRVMRRWADDLNPNNFLNGIQLFIHDSHDFLAEEVRAFVPPDVAAITVMPEKAREIAAHLIKLADEIEGINHA